MLGLGGADEEAVAVLDLHEGDATFFAVVLLFAGEEDGLWFGNIFDREKRIGVHILALRLEAANGIINMLAAEKAELIPYFAACIDATHVLALRIE